LVPTFCVSVQLNYDLISVLHDSDGRVDAIPAYLILFVQEYIVAGGANAVF